MKKSDNMIKKLTDYIDTINTFRKKFHLSQKILFRGQSNSEWPIESSLERKGVKFIPFDEYYTQVDYLKPEINSFGRKFERKIKFPNGYDFDFSDYNLISYNRFPELEYLTYLRHHGFPSPLIDFSQSEYIALFFACEDVLCPEKKIPNGKVIVLQSQLWSLGGTDMAEIHEIGHYIETDKRHVSQQSEYLIACRYGTHDGFWSFVPFASANSLQNQNTRNEFSLEIEISASAKKNLLLELAKMNINHFTLYQDEDSLMKKLTFDFLQRQKKIV